LGKQGTTRFLVSVPPLPEEALLDALGHAAREARATPACLGIHVEGPYLSPEKAGALKGPALRTPTVAEVRRWVLHSQGQLRMVTLAPELPGALPVIRCLAQSGVRVALGHSQAKAAAVYGAMEAGATLVTHCFNGMPPTDHHAPGLLDVALVEDRLIAMVIADGVHVSCEAVRLLLRAKRTARVVLVSDHVGYSGWLLRRRGRAYYRPEGTLAGGATPLLQAVRWLVEQVGIPLHQAVTMASLSPAQALGLNRLGRLAPGKLADGVVFDAHFNVILTLVNGAIVYLNKEKACVASLVTWANKVA
jgi:N-acetylglucosamine-6-phosphate deacetylase